MKQNRTKTIILEKQTVEIDPTTGEATTVRQEFTTKVNRDNFIQAYVEGIQGILKLNSKTDMKVLIALWTKAEWNTNKIILIKREKEMIAKELRYKNSKIIDNAVARLVRKKILIREDTSVYYLNPNFFFRGTSKERLNAIEFVYKLEITDNGK